MKVAVFGASGFSREVADIIMKYGDNEIVFIDLYSTLNTCFGFPIVPERNIPRLEDQGFLFVIGLGNNEKRKNIYEKFKHLQYPNIIHESASMGFEQHEALRSKKGNIITAGVRFTNKVQMGNFGIFNLNCTIGHDCIIKNFVNIAPGSNISGNVCLEEGVYIGTNSTILQGKSIENKMSIGRFATVGAGAIVTKDVSGFSTVVGMPARPITKA